MTWGATTDAAEAERLFVHAREHGIHHFDTAEAYNGGESERILGRLIGNCRESVTVATKVGYDGADGHDIRGRVLGCLARLNTDYIDILYLHRFGTMRKPRQALQDLFWLMDEGKVCKIGVSNCAAWQVQRYYPAAVIQLQYSMLKRIAEVELLPMAQACGNAVYAYSPLARGLLAGKDRRDMHPRYRHRFDGTDWLGLEDYVEKSGEAAVSRAVSWAASHPAVTAAIVGPRNVDQLRECLRAEHMDADKRALWAVMPRPAPATDRPEEAAYA